MKVSRLAIVVCVASAAMMAGADCYVQDSSPPNTCTFIASPALPVHPWCVCEFLNDPVEQAFVSSSGTQWLLPQTSTRCGYIRGTWTHIGSGFYECAGCGTTIANPWDAYKASGPLCTDPR